MVAFTADAIKLIIITTTPAIVIAIAVNIILDYRFFLLLHIVPKCQCSFKAV